MTRLLTKLDNSNRYVLIDKISMIIDSLKSIDGVGSVTFIAPDKFNIQYDSAKVSPQVLLNLDVFETYGATIAI